MKDHEINQAVNELNDIAITYHGTQQMRDQIVGVVLRIRDSFLEKMQLTVKGDRQLRDDLIGVLRKNGFVYKKKEGNGGSSKWHAPTQSQHQERFTPISTQSRTCNDPCYHPGMIIGVSSGWPVLNLPIDYDSQGKAREAIAEMHRVWAAEKSDKQLSVEVEELYGQMKEND